MAMTFFENYDEKSEIVYGQSVKLKKYSSNSNLIRIGEKFSTI